MATKPNPFAKGAPAAKTAKGAAKPNPFAKGGMKAAPFKKK